MQMLAPVARGLGHGQYFFEHRDIYYAANFAPMAKGSLSSPRKHPRRTTPFPKPNVSNEKVIHAGAVKPELQVGCFACDVCGEETAGVRQEFKYTLPAKCSNEGCDNKCKFKWVPGHFENRYGDWQRLRVQESMREMPAGTTPSTLDVVLRGEACETCKAGDRVTIAGFIFEQFSEHAKARRKTIIEYRVRSSSASWILKKKKRLPRCSAGRRQPYEAGRADAVREARHGAARQTDPHARVTTNRRRLLS